MQTENKTLEHTVAISGHLLIQIWCARMLLHHSWRLIWCYINIPEQVVQFYLFIHSFIESIAAPITSRGVFREIPFLFSLKKKILCRYLLFTMTKSCHLAKGDFSQDVIQILSLWAAIVHYGGSFRTQTLWRVCCHNEQVNNRYLTIFSNKIPLHLGNLEFSFKRPTA